MLLLVLWFGGGAEGATDAAKGGSGEDTGATHNFVTEDGASVIEVLLMLVPCTDTTAFVVANDGVD